MFRNEIRGIVDCMSCALYSCGEHQATPASRMHDVGGSRWGDVDQTAVNSKIGSDEHLDHDVHVELRTALIPRHACISYSTRS